MAEKLDYTIQIDEQQYDVTAADSLHADLANQVEEALIVKKSVRKTSIEDIKNNESLAIENLKDAIGEPNTDVGVADANGTPITRTATNAFAFKGDSAAEIEVVPGSGGVFTGPIYAPDINAGDGFNINKFQVTNYNSVDTIIRELKGFPVYRWTGTLVSALTEGTPPTMLPFKVIIYTGPTSGNTDYWTETARANLRLVNCAPDGTTTDCTTDGNFFLINAKAGHLDCGRILLGTFDHTKTTNCSTYVELRVKEANNVTHSIGNKSLGDIFEYTDKSGGTAESFDARIDEISTKVRHAALADVATLARVAEKLGTGTVGSATKPIFLTGGVATECDTYAGGTAVTLNSTNKATNTAAFFAPTTAGSTTQVLIGKGSNDAPSWTNISGLSVLEAKTADEAETVTTNIKNQLITDIFKAASSGTGISTVVKNADISDKLFIYPVGGTSSSPSVGTPVASGNYIYYGENMPDNNAGTDDFRRTGNIYIKIES
jgi:hypothetical protein